MNLSDSPVPCITPLGSSSELRLRRKPRHASRPFSSLSLASPASLMVGLPLVPHRCGPDASESPCIENCLARLSLLGDSLTFAFSFEPPRSGVRGRVYMKRLFTSSIFLKIFSHKHATVVTNHSFLLVLQRKIFFAYFSATSLESESESRTAKHPQTRARRGMQTLIYR